MIIYTKDMFTDPGMKIFVICIQNPSSLNLVKKYYYEIDIVLHTLFLLLNKVRKMKIKKIVVLFNEYNAHV